jgi:antitoxin HicB
LPLSRRLRKGLLTMTESSYPIVLLRVPENEGGGFVAYAPDLDGCKCYGDSASEAVEKALTAIGQWCSELAESGKDVPEPFSASRKSLQVREEMLSIIREQEKLLQEEVAGLRSELSEVRMEFDQIRSRIKQLIQRHNISEAEFEEMVGDGGSSSVFFDTRASDKRRLLN